MRASSTARCLLLLLRGSRQCKHAQPSLETCFFLHVMAWGLPLSPAWPWPPLRASLMRMYHAVLIHFILMEMRGVFGVGAMRNNAAGGILMQGSML